MKLPHTFLELKNTISFSCFDFLKLFSKIVFENVTRQALRFLVTTLEKKRKLLARIGGIQKTLGIFEGYIHKKINYDEQVLFYY